MTLEEMVRQIVRDELRRAASSDLTGDPPPLLVTVPTAARATGISAETLRTWIETGRLPRRTKSTDPNPKRPTFLVSIDEVRSASEGRPARR